MITLTPDFLGHIGGATTNLAVCWKLVRRDGVEIFGTEHDRDITITTGVYQGTYEARTGISGSNVRSSSDLSADNLEVSGMTRQSGDVDLFSVDAADIEAGLLDDADIAVFLVNWEAPDDGERVLRVGTIGNITRTAEGQYRTEMRGLSQSLSQTIVRTYGVACDAELFDARCGLNPAAFTTNSTVTASSSRRSFGASGSFATQVVGGKITFTSGENLGYSMEVKGFAGGTFTLFLPMPADIMPGDTFTHVSGCDKAKATCQVIYNNLVNFRGHGFFVPGQNEVLKIGGQ